VGPRSCPHVCARWCASMGVSAERASRCALSVRSAHVCECPCAQAHGREGTRAPVLVSVPVRARVRVRACACARLPERERERGGGSSTMHLRRRSTPCAWCSLSVSDFFFFSSLVFYKLQSRAESRTPLASVQRHKRGPRCGSRCCGSRAGKRARPRGRMDFFAGLCSAQSKRSTPAAVSCAPSHAPAAVASQRRK